MMSEICINVALCAHNPRPDFLARSLDSLRRQSLSKKAWDFILVDNGSKQPLEEKCTSGIPHARVVRENELGLTPARIRAINETESPLIMFIDDDNVLHEKYLERALAIHRRFPILGAFGAGRLIPEFEVHPDTKLMPHVGCLAIRDVPSNYLSNDPAHEKSSPWGAGLCVTRKIALGFIEELEQHPFLKQLGRRESQLFSGEDIVFSKNACKQGVMKGVFPELAITHLISSHRVSKDYLLRISKGHAFSDRLLEILDSSVCAEQLVNPTWKNTIFNTVNLIIDMARRLKRGGLTDLEFYQAQLAGRRNADQWLKSKGLMERS
jgi:glycosyltransferase involved in cell wall biosynthesis